MITQAIKEDEIFFSSSILNGNTEPFVFITGGSGLVGSHIIQLLLAKGKKIKALYRSRIPDVPQQERVVWVQGDILDVTWLDGAMQDVEEVYHCAALVSFSKKRKQELFKTNIEGTANVVNAALLAGVRKMCFVSSVAALGRSKNGIETNEKMDWSEEANDSNYGKSKYLAEMEVWRGIGEGLQAVIINPAIILGAGDWNDGSTKLFKTAYDQFPWFTEGVTGFTDVKDVADAMVKLMDSEISGERFIVSAENRQYKEIFTLIANAFKRKAPHKKVSRVLADIVWRAEAVKSLFTGKEPLLTKETAISAQSIVLFDNSKLKKYLPSFSYTPVEETIKRVCEELAQKYKL